MNMVVSGGYWGLSIEVGGAAQAQAGRAGRAHRFGWEPDHDMRVVAITPGHPQCWPMHIGTSLTWLVVPSHHTFVFGCVRAIQVASTFIRKYRLNTDTVALLCNCNLQ
jgi:hypothetical protein